MKNVLIAVIICTTINTYSQTFKPSQIKMHWLDKDDIPYTTFSNLKKDYPGLKFITNAGVLNKDLKPTGLYIEKGIIINPIKLVQNTKVNYGTHPTGILYVNEKGAYITEASIHFKPKNITWAIQGGPILINNYILNPRLTNRKRAVRNGVGIKKEGDVYFAILNATYKELALHFKEQGCITAMALSEGGDEVWEAGDKKTSHHVGPMISAE